MPPRIRSEVVTMDVRKRMTIAAAAAGLLLLLGGCATAAPDPGSSGASASPSPTALTGGDEVDMAAAWLDAGRAVGLVTYGSSTCLPTATSSYANGVLDVELVDDPEAICTRDYVPRATLVPLPEEVDPSQELEIRAVGDGYQGDVELDGVPGLSAGGETDYLPSAGFADDEGLIVLLTWGSSSCVPLVASAEATGETTATVTFATPAEDQVCTMDMAPRAQVLSIPGLEDDDVVLTLTGDPSLEGATVAVLPN